MSDVCWHNVYRHTYSVRRNCHLGEITHLLKREENGVSLYLPSSVFYSLLSFTCTCLLIRFFVCLLAFIILLCLFRAPRFLFACCLPFFVVCFLSVYLFISVFCLLSLLIIYFSLPCLSACLLSSYLSVAC